MRTRRTLRLIITAVALAAAGLVSSGLPAEGRAPTGQVAPYLDRFSCSADPAHLISVSWFGDAYRGAVNWVPEHFVAPPGAPWEVAYDDGIVRLVAHGQYLPLPGEPFRRGTMTLTAQVEELSTTVTRSGGGRGSGDSNDQQVHLEIARALEVVGTAHVEFDNGHTTEVSGCTGSVVTRMMDRQSDPRAGVASGTTSGAWCTPFEHGTRVDELGIDTATEDWGLTLSTYDDNGTPDDIDDDRGAFYVSQTTVTLAQIVEGAVVDLTGETLTGEPVSAVITLHWTAADVAQTALWSGTWTTRSTATSGPMPAGVAYDDGSVVELDCFAYRNDYRRVDAGGGSPPTAHPPANDAPAGAVPLAGVTSVQTSGTALEAEEPNPCTEPWDEQPDYRATHTAWFTITGNGPTTVDTTGTRFDTALAVYTSDDAGTLTPLDGACNDDWWRPLTPELVALSLQARTTFVAEPGTTYLVQVGGVSSDANYGSLRISVGSP
jgi:hypothetical protein